MRAHRYIILLAILIAIFSGHRVRGDFSGAYTFAPNEGSTLPSQFPTGVQFTRAIGTWTLSGKIDAPFFTGLYPLMGVAPSEFYFNTGPPLSFGHSYYSEQISLTHAIAASGMLSFDYSVSLGSPYSTFSQDIAGYTIDGAITALPAGTGSVDIAVQQGQVFGFYLFAGPDCVTCQPPWGSQSILDVTNFIAPVPEPTTITLLVCGAGVLLIRARARLRAREVVDLANRSTQKVLM